MANSGPRLAALQVKQYTAVDPTKNLRLLIAVCRQSIAVKFARKGKRAHGFGAAVVITSHMTLDHEHTLRRDAVSAPRHGNRSPKNGTRFFAITLSTMIAIHHTPKILL